MIRLRVQIPRCQVFDSVLLELKELHDKKGADYDNRERYSNFRGSEDWGIPPWLGVMLRVNDKLNRIKTFATKGNLQNESVEDSLKDIATYMVIALVLWREDAVRKEANKPTV